MRARDFEGKLPHSYLSLRGPGERAIVVQKRETEERLSSGLSVFSFVPLRAALKVFVLLSKERICVLGKNPRFCQGALFVLSLFISIAGLSLSLSHASRKRESDESVVILLVSRF